jgi:DhnA family fructose-bisphosphate aldolase class Ia
MHRRNNMGKIRRLRHIFREDGKTLIIAMDHGTNAGAMPGIENPGKAIASIVAGGADAIIANPGLAKAFESALAGIGLILRLDLPPTMIGKGHESLVAYDVRYALQLGADAVIVNGAPGVEMEKITLPAIAKVVQACDPVGMPVVGEMAPGGFDAEPSYRTLENLVLSARIASELGADMVKIAYSPGFEKVVRGCFCPVVVLGGSKSPDAKVFLSSIKEAIDAGAKGVAVGRNAWGAENIYGMARALAAIVHGGASAEEAYELLGEKWAQGGSSI